MTHERIGIFEILADNGEKYHFRRLTVRCTRCGAVAEREYASVKSRSSRTCQHCPRRLVKRAIVELLRARGELTGRHIGRLLPPEHTRRRDKLAEILVELVEAGEVVRFRATGEQRTWTYDVTHR
jgi:hypothetical protein